MREVVCEHASGESLGFWEEFAQENAPSAAPKSQSATTQQVCMSCM